MCLQDSLIGPSLSLNKCIDYWILMLKTAFAFSTLSVACLLKENILYHFVSDDRVGLRTGFISLHPIRHRHIWFKTNPCSGLTALRFNLPSEVASGDKTELKNVTFLICFFLLSFYIQTPFTSSFSLSIVSFFYCLLNWIVNFFFFLWCHCWKTSFHY